ncbi:MAG: endonuclease Q family protein [bacterium]|nr:endonuclease Q family protein [bacterium]
MKIIADLHLHSKYSRAVSPRMVVPEISRVAGQKGIDLVGTGDWTHPLWLRELEEGLEEAEEGIFKVQSSKFKVQNGEGEGEGSEAPPREGYQPEASSRRLCPAGGGGARFILSTEISSIYSQGGKGRRIHNLILAPSFATVRKINEALIKRGANLISDGRPIVGLSSRDLFSLVMETDENCLVICAHIWTPWFSLYGSKSGFDSIDECFGEYGKRICAVETGLSSDPAMNWQIKELENRSIVSFGDAHSPEKIGREATVFEEVQSSKFKVQSDSVKPETITYNDIVAAIKQEENSKLKIAYTIEFYPEEGMYHYTGHRNCKVVQSPEETKKLGTICPVCKGELTVGVMHRVEELSSKLPGLPTSSRLGRGRVAKAEPRAGKAQSSPPKLASRLSSSELRLEERFSAGPPLAENIKIETDEKGVKWISTENRLGFVRIVPLLEIIAEALETTETSQKAISEYNNLTKAFGSEFGVLLEAPVEELMFAASGRIAEGIKRMRAGDIVINPGFDGQYGVVKIWPEGKDEIKETDEQAQMALF